MEENVKNSEAKNEENAKKSETKNEQTTNTETEGTNMKNTNEENTLFDKIGKAFGIILLSAGTSVVTTLIMNKITGGCGDCIDVNSEDITE